MLAQDEPGFALKIFSEKPQVPGKPRWRVLLEPRFLAEISREGRESFLSCGSLIANENLRRKEAV